MLESVRSPKLVDLAYRQRIRFRLDRDEGSQVSVGFLRKSRGFGVRTEVNGTPIRAYYREKRA